MQIYGRTTPSILALADRVRDIPISIRWGGPLLLNEGLNSRSSFRNGLQQLQRFSQAEVPTVEFTSNRLQAEQWAANTIVFGRRLNHTQGRDIIVYGHRHWPFRNYWTKYCEAIEEWRVHIFQGSSIARGKKIYVDGHPPTHHPIIRSRRKGWHIEHETNPPKGLRFLAKQAVKAVGYDFGAVDIIKLADNSYRVLEVNSRPALRDEYTLAAYEKAIRRAYVRI